MPKTLVVQIPAYNEEAHIDSAIRDVPAQVAGFDRIRIVVLDDGSVDRTAEIAGSSGLASVLRLPHGGLGTTFRQGLRHALSLGADVIVNIDADLQYKGGEIPGLVAPILEGGADVVIGDRQLRQIPGYPRFKLFTQTGWSALIGRLFNVEVRDATSGFRAYSREAAELLAERLRDPYTYSSESLYVLALSGKRVAFVPITIRPEVRASRLITNKWVFAKRFATTLLRYAGRRPTVPQA